MEDRDEDTPGQPRGDSDAPDMPQPFQFPTVESTPPQIVLVGLQQWPYPVRLCIMPGVDDSLLHPFGLDACEELLGFVPTDAQDRFQDGLEGNISAGPT
jgi:hypothetical protein